MNELFERASCRSFKDFPVETEKTEAILKAGMQAPSMGNQQPWEFLVIEDKKSLKKLAGVDKFALFVEKTPTVVVLLANEKALNFPETWMLDCSAAAENMLLEAQAQGLGAYWLGVAPFEERMKFVSELLDLPDYVKPFALIGFGRKNRRTEAEDRFDESKIHREVY